MTHLVFTIKMRLRLAMSYQSSRPVLLIHFGLIVIVMQ